jgi:hypothetical protein
MLPRFRPKLGSDEEMEEWQDYTGSGNRLMNHQHLVIARRYSDTATARMLI